MKHNSRKASLNTYERLDPLSGPDHELREQDAMTLIKGMMTEQKREQRKRALPDLTPVCTEQDVSDDKQNEADKALSDVRRVPTDVKSDLMPSLLNYARRPPVWVLAVLCLLFLSGLLSVTVVLVVVLALLFVLIFGPEPVLDLIFPNWRTRPRTNGRWLLSAFKK